MDDDSRARSDQPLYLDRKTAAKQASVSQDTITAAIHAGKLRAKRSGVRVMEDGTRVPVGKFLISRDALDEWFQSLPDA